MIGSSTTKTTSPRSVTRRVRKRTRRKMSRRLASRMTATAAAPWRIRVTEKKNRILSFYIFLHFFPLSLILRSFQYRLSLLFFLTIVYINLFCFLFSCLVLSDKFFEHFNRIKDSSKYIPACVLESFIHFT